MAEMACWSWNDSSSWSGSGWGASDWDWTDPAGGGGARLQGLMSEWNDEKACGFIEFEGSQGKRVFVHKHDFAEPLIDGQAPEKGTVLNFVMGTDASTGKQRAQDVRVGPAETAPQSGLRLQGQITKWSIEKGCGFVQCIDPPGTSYFAHKSEFKEKFEDSSTPAVGTGVTFCAGLDPYSPGRERATEIERLPEGALRQEGRLVSWEDEKVCGFIETPVGKRFFCHKSEFKCGSPPPLGMEVSFMPGVDMRSGKRRATDIRRQGQVGGLTRLDTALPGEDDLVSRWPAHSAAACGDAPEEKRQRISTPPLPPPPPKPERSEPSA